ncbi:MAG: Holliday junction branch migration protein RuvA [Mycoplasmatales bacterium]
MIDYLKGSIEQVEDKYIVLEVNNIGYKIFMPNKDVKDNDKIYIYQKINETTRQLFGFKTIEERELFLKLLTIKGIGVMVSMTILGKGIENCLEAIKNKDVKYFKTIPKIGDKTAQQIIEALT